MPLTNLTRMSPSEKRRILTGFAVDQITLTIAMKDGSQRLMTPIAVAADERMSNRDARPFLCARDYVSGDWTVLRISEIATVEPFKPYRDEEEEPEPTVVRPIPVAAMASRKKGSARSKRHEQRDIHGNPPPAGIEPEPDPEALAEAMRRHPAGKGRTEA